MFLSMVFIELITQVSHELKNNKGSAKFQKTQPPHVSVRKKMGR